MDNDIVLPDLLVSRHHAELKLTAEGYELSDLGSHNGTFVNGRRIGRRLLQELDVVGIGHHLFRLAEHGLEEYVDEGSVSFQAAGLTVRVAGGRLLLHDVSFSLDERSFLAVVGPSGAGKTTLLNALTGFRPADEGGVLYAGRDLYAEYDELRARIGFVPQEDIVHPPLTVKQALDYAAKLRFSDDVSSEDRRRRVTEVTAELGLTAVSDAPIRLLSGGQRRRVSVGLELITKPSLLFLDEPTSGLDPGYELNLMRLLRELADGGRTVVIVTHSVQSLRLCDRVLFLAPGGHTAYFGPAQLGPDYFGRNDFQEVFQDLNAIEDRDWAAQFKAHPYHHRYIESRIEADPQPSPEGRERPGLPSPRSWISQFATLTSRYWRVMASDRGNLGLLLLQPLVLGLIMLLALPPHELQGPPAGEIRPISRAGLVLLVVTLGITWLGASNAIREVVKELPIFRRERAVGLSVTAYVASKAVVLGAVTILQAAVLVPVALARQGGPDHGSLIGWPLPELVAAAALAGLAGMALALLISSLASSADTAISILPVVLIIEMLLAMGGVFPDLVDKPVLKQGSYLASTQWAFSASASTVSLDRLQAVDRLARAVPTIRIADPSAALREIGRARGGERRWRHTAQAWLSSAGVLLALTLAGVAGSMVALRRRRPEA